jgi:hypothetical protein
MNRSSIDDSRSTEIPVNPLSSHFRVTEVLTQRYGENTNQSLKSKDIKRVIQAGDSFIRKDAVDYISSYLEEQHGSIWHEPILASPPFDGTLNERLYKTFHYSDTIEQRSAVDPVRLRMARVLLYWYFGQLCTEIRNNGSSRRSRGRDTASIALDTLFKEIYQSQEGVHDAKVTKRRRASLQKHKQIGRRWTMLINCIGPGVLLICTPELAAEMYEIYPEIPAQTILTI